MNLRKTDSVDVYSFSATHYFIEADCGDYSANKDKLGKWHIQKYAGSRNEYIEENELKQPRRLGLRMVLDFFGTNIDINNVPLESVE